VKGLQEYIRRYRDAPFDKKGQAWGKVRVIEWLQPSDGDPDVLAFLLGILADPGEYQAARLHLLKWFECKPARRKPEAHRRIGECIAATLRKETEWVVKAWLARVACMYREVPAVIDAVAERLLDRSESLDVRLGCHLALRFAGPTEQVVRVFRELAGDADEVGEDARADLAKWGKAEPSAAPDRGGAKRKRGSRSPRRRGR
jgi:hypothetical protein